MEISIKKLYPSNILSDYICSIALHRYRATAMGGSQVLLSD